MASDIGARDPIRLVRIIARLNVGGPAIQAITLTSRLTAYGYRTHLLRGREAPDEGSMDYLAVEQGVSPTLIAGMRREPGRGDLAALWEVIRILRRERPAIVHTHAAKAGTLGRVATVIAFPIRSRRPVLIHTYHGHSLTGYFSDRTARVYRMIEQVLARRTDRLIAVSGEVRDDLVGLGVAPVDQFEVIPLGFDLHRFLDDAERPERRARLRAEWGVGDDEQVVTLVARLVPIKRVDRFLRIARSLADRSGLRFVIAGDGELRDTLRQSEDARALGDRLVWAGFRRDMPDVCFASEVIVLTSDNEGTPVSLIEAQAAAVPVVGTAVGGVASAIRDGVTGLLAGVDAEDTFASHVAGLLDDPEFALRLGAAGREHASAAHRIERLADDHDRLYRQLLNGR